MVKAARAAARLLLRDFGEVEQLQVSIKGPGDFVSRADQAAERAIRAELEKARPDYGLLLEEAGPVKGASPHNRFLVDPLDGTTNFLHGQPHWAISIALEQHGEVTAGVVYDPIREELFVAEKGKGAYLNDRRLRVSRRLELDTALIGCGLPVQGWTGRSRGFAAQLDAVADRVAGLRRMGVASLDLAYVAAGRLDGFWEYGLKPWDFAAGMLLVREAGGRVARLEEDAAEIWTEGTLVAANPDIFERLAPIVAAAIPPA
jgi:myo-inositol-1(or 4)-monophosphatase